MRNNQRFYGWTLVVVLFLINFFASAFPYSGGSVINTFMAESLNMDRSSLGLGFALLGVSVGLSAPLVSFFVNRWGARLTSAIGTGIILGGALLMNFVVTEAWHFIVIYGLFIGVGMGFATMIPIQTTLTFWFNKRRGLAMSIVLSAGGLGAFTATNLLNYVITAADGNWRAGWMVVMATSVFCAVIALLFIRNKPEDVGQVPDGIRVDETAVDENGAHSTTRTYHSPIDWKVADALRTRAFWLIILASIGFMAPFTTCMAHAVIHLKSLNHTPEIAALALGLMSMTSLIGRLGTGVLADRIEPRFIWGGALFLMIAGTFALMNADRQVMIYAFSILMGIGFGAAYICFATIVGNYYGAGAFASMMGIVLTIATIGSSLAPFLAGVIFDTQGSYQVAFYGVMCLALLGGIGVLFAGPPKLPAAADVQETVGPVIP